MVNLKDLLEDRVKFSEVMALVILCVFAFLLLAKNDLGRFRRLDTVMSDARENVRDLDKVKELKRYIEHFNSTFVERKSANWLMETLNQMAQKANLSFSSMKPLEGMSVAGYRLTRVSGNGTAAYTSILLLVKDIEEFGKYMFVEELSISTLSAAQGSPLILGEVPAASSGQTSAKQPVNFTINVCIVGT